MPEAIARVVTNSTPLISLTLIGKLYLLHELYSDIYVPPAVYHEVLAGGRYHRGTNEIQSAFWIIKADLANPMLADALASDLDQGEAEAIALAKEIKADLLIMDERLGRQHATRLNLTITGTLGVLLRAKSEKLIPAVKPLIIELQQGGIFLGERVVAETLSLASE